MLLKSPRQEAFAAAVDQWKTDGVPDIPRAWIIQTAKYKAIDRIRRQSRFQEKLESYAELFTVRKSRTTTWKRFLTIDCD